MKEEKDHKVRDNKEKRGREGMRVGGGRQLAVGDTIMCYVVKKRSHPKPVAGPFLG